MKWTLLVLFICFLEVISVSGVISHLNDDDYYRMPPLVELEPFERCFRKPDAVYCTASFTYIADNNNPLLLQMMEFSEHRTHFNHTQTFFGICYSVTCKHLLSNSLDLGSTLEACLNETVYDKYKLKVRLLEEDSLYCISRNGSKMVIDTADIVVGIVVMIFIALIFVGSLFDINYLEEAKNGVVSQILLCFSLPRNWEKLHSSRVSKDPRIERLKAINGVRTNSTSLVIMAHAILPTILLTKNPEWIEEIYSNPIIHIIVNGTLIMQTFLLISAFLMIYNLQIFAEKNTVTWKMLPGFIIKRWLRLTPPYAMILALTATWLRHLGTGPLWHKAVLGEVNACRKDWWMNLLYISNYIDGSHCMPQTWYLPTDIQLYAIGLVLYLLGRDLAFRKVLLGGFFLLSLITPALHTYFQDLDGTLLITPTVVTNFFVNDPNYNKIYRRGHTNMSGYLIGIGLGYLVYHLQKNQFQADNYKKWCPIYWLILPIFLLLVTSNMVFYEGPRVNVIYRALAAAAYKPAFAFCIAVLLLGFFVQFESVYRSVVEWDGWRLLSRVSYSAYLIHLTIIRACTGLYTDTFTVSYLRMLEVITLGIVLTYLLAIVFWLTVESPLAQLTSIVLQTKRSPDNTKDDKNKDL